MLLLATEAHQKKSLGAVFCEYFFRRSRSYRTCSVCEDDLLLGVLVFSDGTWHMFVAAGFIA